ncbi:hypothetical protein PNA2_0071 [Pyrococcus sp. NA2]|uniref:ABC transporter permease n=1 Tax=Pyrococcus sp. (strain NA2) TaxID=342949 RepID=UPI000209ADB0|nr:ABC transporter permease [Pyrococcus sp. NA2]AEC50989.1 hypothetical protein PNA2_0071 [Pyrococcus sp. NA2]
MLRRWELNEPTRVMTLLIGMILNTFILHSAYLRFFVTLGSYISTIVTTPSFSSLFLVNKMIADLLSNGNFWITSTLFISLLGAIIFRMDRDIGYANLIYSLPYRKWEIIGIKYIVLFLYSLMLTFIPFFSVAILSNLSIAEHLPGILFSRLTMLKMLLTLYIILYMTTLVTLVSLLSPSTLMAFVASISLLFLPFFIHISEVPPLIFLESSVKEVFTPKCTIWGVIVPLALLTTSIITSERRDVR